MKKQPKMPNPESTNAPFTESERKAVYKCIHTRRDVRSQFLSTPVPDHVLAEILRAGHHAPSVGFMQPWDFTLIRDASLKMRIHDAFLSANNEAAAMFEEEKALHYRSLKLAGILDAPIGLCITCDRSRHGPVVLGKTHQPQMDLYSVVCAVQNIWLAARAEGIGVGWVSIINPHDLRAVLSIPPNIEIVAYLCLGYVTHFLPKPELENVGWLKRMKLSDVVSVDRWRDRDASDSLYQHLDFIEE